MSASASSVGSGVAEGMQTFGIEEMQRASEQGGSSSAQSDSSSIAPSLSSQAHVGVVEPGSVSEPQKSTSQGQEAAARRSVYNSCAATNVFTDLLMFLLMCFASKEEVCKNISSSARSIIITFSPKRNYTVNSCARHTLINNFFKLFLIKKSASIF